MELSLLFCYIIICSWTYTRVLAFSLTAILLAERRSIRTRGLDVHLDGIVPGTLIKNLAIVNQNCINQTTLKSIVPRRNVVMNTSQDLRRAWKIAKTLMHPSHGPYTSQAQMNIDHGHHPTLHMIGLLRQIIEWPGSLTLLANWIAFEGKTMRTGCRRKVSKSLFDDICRHDFSLVYHSNIHVVILAQ